MIFTATFIFAQEIDYEHLRLSKKNLNRMKFSNTVDIVFSSGILLAGASASALGVGICIETNNMEFPQSDPSEHDDYNPFVIIFFRSQRSGLCIGRRYCIRGLSPINNRYP